MTNTNNGQRGGNRPNVRLTFKKIFYFSTTAIANPNPGGTASSSPATAEVQAPISNTSATTTATFTATPNTGYRFSGWSQTANGSIVSSNNPYAATITSTSTNSASPTNTTLYARFNELTAVNPTSITATDIPVDKGNTITANNYVVDATGLTADQYVHNFVTATSGNTSVATVTNTNGTFTITGVEEGTAVITITAYNTDNTTPACSTTFTVTVQDIQTGVSGGTVTLDDREDHTWAYYNKELGSPIRSWNPADVKITYYGNGTDNISTTNGASPASNSWEEDASTVKVGPNDAADTFIYYKTLERLDGSTSDNPTGLCEYTTIPNPFSVRPTYQYANGDLNKYCGFYMWRIKKIKNGKIYDAATNGSQRTEWTSGNVTTANMLYADHTYYFQPDDEYGMEVELEALWARAYVVTSNTTTGLNNNVSYERNFVYLSSNTTLRDAALSYPVTYTTVDPASGSGTKRTITIRDGFTCEADTKFENLTFAQYNNNAQTLTAAGHDLIVGRGCTGTVNFVRGLNANASSPQYSIRLESGTYNIISLVDGHTNNSNASSITVSGTPKAYLTLGCDYDRAQDVTNGTFSNKLNVNTAVGLGRGPTIGSNAIMNEKTFTFRIKSGTICSSYDMSNYLANFSQSVYISSHGGSTYVGRRTLYIEGGEIAGVAGGMDNQTNNDYLTVDIRMTGGHIRGAIYGGGSQVTAGGTKRIVVTGGTVTGWLGAGANGTSDAGGQTYGKGFVYFGGKAKSGGTGSNNSINGSVGGIIFGAGNGTTASTTSGSMQNGTNVVIADDCEVERDVYGGGNLGYAVEESNVYILGGTVNGGVYGGANQKQGPEINLTMKGGIVKGGVYGGSNTTGVVSGPVTMQIDGGQVGTSSTPANIHGGGYGQPTVITGNVDITLGNSGQTTQGATVYGDVYGGSALGYVNGTTATNTYHTYVTLNKGIINGSLYGGGLGDANTAANVYGPVKVKVYGGSVKKTDANGANGSGGVYGANNVNGAPQRSVTVDIYGTDPAPSENEYALYAVYGGGNAADYTYGNGYPTVKVHNCNNSIEYVYGGGNAAAVAATDVTIYGGNKIGTVFGGGNGSVTAANVNGDAVTKIYGGTIGKVFGGSNSQGTISGDISVTVAKGGEADTDPDGSSTACDMHIDEVYGGGNMANSQAGSISIGCTGNEGEGIGDVYGGANQANITGDISLEITGGSIQRVFGGNNTSGTISGTIQVDVNWKTGNEACGYNYLGNVFGGGNLAPYTGSPAVNILNGTVSGNVYGGGAGELVDGAQRGAKGKVTGNPTVTIGDNVSGHTAIVSGDVYGGGDAADVAGTPVIVVNDCNTEIGYLYGGGNAADVNGTNITINGGTIHHDAFGGGHGDKDASTPSKYADVKGNVVFNVYGGTIDRVFAGSNSKGNITGTSALTINKTGNCAMKIGQVYGGGNEAAGKASSVNIGCTGTLVSPLTGSDRYGYEQEGINMVFGGANQADIGTAQNPSNIEVNINSGIVANVFGGNNTSGDIHGTITVNIEMTNESNTCGWYVGNVFGGGNLARYSGSPAVNIKNGTVSQNVYGGGKGDPTATGDQVGVPGSVTGNPVVTIGDTQTAAYVATILGDVYGGGDAAKVVGSSTINFPKANNTAAKLFGGGNAADVTGAATVNISNGTVTTGVYGGCNSQGSVDGTINVNITGGTVGAANSLANVHGGGYGANTETAGDVNVTINGASVNIYGDVYGGSGFGDVNNELTDATKVTLTAGTINGNLYGGGLGDANKAALVKGTADVEINGGTVTGKVFGANNVNGTPLGKVTVTINGTDTPASGYALSEVYGGGNMADYNPTNVTPATVVVNGCNNSIGVVYGGGNAADVLGTDVTIWGGTIGQVFGGGHGDKDAEPATEANVVKRGNDGGNVAVKVYGGTIGEVFGGSNSKGTIQGASTVTIEDNGGSCTFNITDVYGGGNQAEGNAGTLSIGCGAIITGNVYGGAKAANVNNDIHLVITGGTLHNVFGGNNESGTIAGTITVDINQDNSCTTWHVDNVYGGGNLAAYSKSGTNYPVVNIMNGTVSGNVFGGGYGSTATVTANPHVNLTGGTVTGNVFGGGEAAPVTGAPVVTANYGQATNIYGGGLGSTAVVTGNPRVIIEQTSGKTLTVTDVFGGGDAAAVTGSTAVTLTDGTVRNIYGGGNAAGVSQAVTVTINGGAVSAGVYGGCNASGTIGTDITLGLNGGTISTTGGTTNVVFGGGYGAGTSTNGNVTVNVNGSTIHGHVYGGSALGSVNAANANNTTTIHVLSGTVNGNIYGGGLGEANVMNGTTLVTDNSAKGQVNGTVTVNIGSGTVNTNTGFATATSGSATINGSVYGCNNTNGSPKANVTVNVYQTAHNEGANGYAIDQVFGGGNRADYTPTSTSSRAIVHVYTCDNTIRRVFGGGNAAAATGIQTIIDGGRYDFVFGGGNGESSAANIGAGGTDLQIHGGKINTLFGGSNTSGTITGPMRVSVDAVGDCGTDMYVAEFFCGNNLADIGTQANPTNLVATIGCGTRFGDVYGGCNLADIYGSVTLTIEGGTMTNVYGGSKGRSATSDPSNSTPKAADINGDVTLNITGGSIGNAFGGSNVNGNITGSIEVNVEKAADPCIWSLGNVYGASNLAAYTPTATGNSLCVNIKNGEVTGSVFGGGLGATAIVTSNPVVTIGDNNSSHSAIVTGNVYGGGDAAAVTGNTSVTYNDANTSSQVANLFGGGNQAGVSGTSTVSLTSGKVTTGIYGGCNTSGTVGGNIVVTLLGGTVGASGSTTKANVHGGGFGSATATSGNVTVNIGTKSGTTYSGTATIYGDVYGGSALGSVNTNTSNTTQVNLYHGTIHGDAYGGGLGQKSGFFGKTSEVEAKVYGNVTVKLNETVASDNCWVKGNIFGCNNLNGTPKGHALVHIYKTVTKNANGEVLDKPAKNKNIYELAAVYGGGNMAAYEPVSNTDFAEVIIDGCDYTSIETIYGGGNAASAPATSVTVNQTYEIGTIFGGGNGKDDLNNGTINLPNPGANVGYKAANYTYDTSKTKEENETALDAAFEAQKNGLEYGTGEAKVNAFGGMIHKIFGGSNTKGNVRHESEAFIDERYSNDCPLQLDEVYGGGNEAYMDGGSSVKLGCISYLKTLYGGANAAFVGGDVVLNVTSGTFDRVFGGNNTSGTINGSITVNIEEVGCHPVIIGELYGCGNLASYTTPSGKTHPTINVKSFTSIGRIFGGGLGASAVVTGNPTVNISVVKGDFASTAYAGSSVTLDGVTINLPAHDANAIGAIGTVFGGGNAAQVVGNTNVNIGTEATIKYTSDAVDATGRTVLGADIRGNVFGGGNQAKVTGNTNVVVGKDSTTNP